MELGVKNIYGGQPIEYTIALVFEWKIVYMLTAGRTAAAIPTWPA